MVTIEPTASRKEAEMSLQIFKSALTADRRLIAPPGYRVYPVSHRPLHEAVAELGFARILLKGSSRYLYRLSIGFAKNLISRDTIMRFATICAKDRSDGHLIDGMILEGSNLGSFNSTVDDYNAPIYAQRRIDRVVAENRELLYEANRMLAGLHYGLRMSGALTESGLISIQATMEFCSNPLFRTMMDRFKEGDPYEVYDNLMSIIPMGNPRALAYDRALSDTTKVSADGIEMTIPIAKLPAGVTSFIVKRFRRPGIGVSSHHRWCWFSFDPDGKEVKPSAEHWVPFESAKTPEFLHEAFMHYTSIMRGADGNRYNYNEPFVASWFSMSRTHQTEDLGPVSLVHVDVEQFVEEPSQEDLEIYDSMFMDQEYYPE